LFAGDDDLAVKIWNSDSMQCVQVIRTNCTVASIKLSCTHVAIGSFNAEAGLWTRTGEMLGRYVGHTSAVFAVDFNISWDIFVTGSADNTTMLWSLADRTPLRSVRMLFKPTSVHLIFPSDTPQESNIFMLVASSTVHVMCETWFIKCFVADNNEQCRLWPPRFCNRKIILSDEVLPESPNQVPLRLRLRSVGADVVCNKKLILACLQPAGCKERMPVFVEDALSVEIKEFCISFEYNESASKLSSGANFVSSSEVKSMLCSSSRYLSSLGDDRKLMLLAAGLKFSLYLHPVRHNYEIIIVHHSSYSHSQCVGVLQLPDNCR